MTLPRPRRRGYGRDRIQPDVHQFGGAFAAGVHAFFAQLPSFWSRVIDAFPHVPGS
jgi:hypothetical protein